MRRLCLIKPHVSLGKGAQGVVVVGLWDGCLPVAVKLFKEDDWGDDAQLMPGDDEAQGDGRPRQDILSEISILSQVGE